MQTLNSTHRLSLTAVLALLFLVLSMGFPKWSSAQNSRIAFVGNQSGSWQLYTVNPDGSGMTQITNLPATDFDLWVPDFSPDGKQITFCYGTGPSSGNAQVEIYVMNVDGTNLVQLTNDGLFDCAPRWSPDGSHIIFVRQDPVSFGTVVTTMLPDGTQMTPLTSRFWGAFRSGYSPDMEHIFYESQQGGFVSVLWAMNADGSNQTRLTAAALRAGDIAVSPDGQHLAFNNNQNSPTVLPNRIFTVNFDGTNLRQLTHGGPQVHDEFPNYSPDGTKIVFASDRLETPLTFDLFTMNANGTHLTRIATGITVGGCIDVNCVTPAWGRVPTTSSSGRGAALQGTLTGYCFGADLAGCYQLKDPVQCPAGTVATTPVHKTFYCPHHNSEVEYVDSSRGCQVKSRTGTVYGYCMVN